MRRFFPSTIRQAGASFSPSDLAGLEWWYDVSDLSTITKDMSNRVSQINDKSGNSRNMAPSAGANQPLYNPTGLFSTYPTIDFLASNSEDLTTSFNLGALPICWFGLIVSPDNTATKYFSSYYVNGSSTVYFAQQLANNLTSPVYRFTSNILLGGGGTANPSTQVFYSEKNAATKRKISLGGDLSGVDTQAYGGFDTLAMSKLRSVSTGQFYDNSFAEFFGYSVIPSDTDKQLVFDYFNDKYGITVPTI